MNQYGRVLDLRMGRGNSNVVSDVSHYHNNGNIYGALRDWDVGISFDGVDDYVDCGNDSSLDLTGAMTFECWLYLISGVDGYLIAKNDAGAGDHQFAVNVKTADNSFRFFTNGAEVGTSAANSVVLNEWVHLAVTLDSSLNLVFYVNGVQSGATVPGVALPLSTNFSVSVGRRKPNHFFFLWMDR